MDTIKNSVGRNGINYFPDVAIVQKLLKENGFPHLAVDGVCGANTIKAILTYQKNFYHHPDGLISPNNKTILLLTSPGHAVQKSLDRPDGATGINPGGRKNNPRYMSPSQNCFNLLQAYEQEVDYPYSDTDGHATKKKLTSWDETATIGFGHLIKNATEFETFKDGIDNKQANEIFKNDSKWIIDDVCKYLKVDLTQNEFDAIFMLAFNIGPGSPHSVKHRGLYWSKVLKIINGESNDDLDAAWLAYDISRGSKSSGLLKRRKSELNVYHKGIYLKL